LTAEDEAIQALAQQRRAHEHQESQRGLSRAALRRKKKTDKNDSIRKHPSSVETEDSPEVSYEMSQTTQATQSPEVSSTKKKRKSGEFSGNREKRQRPTESYFATSPASALGRSTVQEMNGVLVRELTPGEGPPAKNGDSLSLLYTLRVDSKRLQHVSNPNAPFVLKLGNGQVVPGLDSGLLGLRPGGSREIAIPPSLAYGEQGNGKIPPNATLNFTVKLLTLDNSAVVDFSSSNNGVKSTSSTDQAFRRRRPRGTRGGTRVNKRRLAAQVASECGNFVLTDH